MCQKYILQMDHHQSFPFGLPQFDSKHAIVRVQYTTRDSIACELFRKNLILLSNIQSPYLIPIYGIQQNREKSITLDYEFISEPLIGSKKFQETAFIQQTKRKIYKLLQDLAQNGIKYFPNAYEIGLDSQGEPKVYVRIDFEVISRKEAKQLLGQYQKWIEQLFESIRNLKQSKISITSKTSTSEYTEKFDKLLSEIQVKIKSKRHRFRTRKWSHSKLDREYTKNGSLISQIHLKKARNNSFSQIQSKPENVKLILKKSEFFCQSNEKQKSLEEWSESSKEGSLSQRVSQALLKTSKMFKVYQRLSKRRI